MSRQFYWAELLCCILSSKKFVLMDHWENSILINIPRRSHNITEDAFSLLTVSNLTLKALKFFLDLSPNCFKIFASINFNDFCFSCIESYDWLWLLCECLNSLCYNFFSIICTTTCLCAFQTPFNTNLLWCIYIKDRVWFTNNLFPHLSLFDCTGETIK